MQKSISIFVLQICLVVFSLISMSSAALAGTTYYVDGISGNDNRDGRSPNSAWRTLGKASQSVRETSANVLLRSGSVFEDQYLRVRWSGTEADWATVGCYVRRSNGTARNCSETDKRPEINGTFEKSDNVITRDRMIDVRCDNNPARLGCRLLTIRIGFKPRQDLLNCPPHIHHVNRNPEHSNARKFFRSSGRRNVTHRLGYELNARLRGKIINALGMSS